MRNQTLSTLPGVALAFLFTLSFFQNAFSQGQNLDDGASLYDKHFEGGAAITAGSFDIGLTTDSGHNISWSYCTSAGCTPSTLIPANTSISLPGTGIDVAFSPTGASRVVRISAGSPNNDVSHLTVRATFTGPGAPPPVQREYDFIVRDPYEMVFVLDWSGSMECNEGANTNAEWPCSGHTSRRWDKLESAIGEFLNQIDAPALLTNDRFSVVYFSGNVLTDPPQNLDGLDFSVNFTTIDNATGGLVDNMGTVSVPQLGRDGTGIGGGINEAIVNRYSAVANRRRVLLLFTDGEQNRTPYLRVSGSTAYIDKNNDNMLTSGEEINSTIPDLEVFPIAVGQFTGMPSISHLFDLLSGAIDSYHVGPSNNILKGMSDAFNDIYNAYSPEYISVEEQVPDTLNQVTFTCNGQVSRLFFKAQFDNSRGNDYTYLLEWNGDAVDSSNYKLRIGDYFANLIVDFRNIDSLNSKGEWTFSCRLKEREYDSDGYLYDNVVVLTDSSEVLVVSEQDGGLRLSAIADDHTLDLDVEGLDGLKVGDPMKPVVQLSLNGQPLKGAEVKALIVKPGEDLGDLLARANVTTDDDPNPEFGLCSTQKFSKLWESNSPELEQYFDFQETNLTLLHQGGGRYSASYDGLDISGVYEVFFYIQATDPDVGIIERFKSKYVNVRFGEIDLSLAGKSPKLGGQSSPVIVETSFDDNQATLGFTPAYRSGNRILLAGAGLQYGLHVEGEGISQLSLSDQCNGKYELTFPADKNTKVRVSLFEEEVYEGKVKNFDKPYYKYPGGVSLHTGITYPLEDLDTLYDGSLFVEADFGYQFLPYVSIEGTLGYYGFTNSFNILGASIYTKGQFNLSQASLFAAVAAGGGYYFPKEEASSAGVNLRASVIRRFNMRWDVSIEAAYFRMLEAGQYSWGTLGAGLKYRF